MTRIRVDPANLRQTTQQLSGIADRLRALGNEAHQATFNAPSYEGQFGPKARAMGMEAEARLRAQADRLIALSEELESRAAAFEAVDQETLTAFERLTQLLQGWIEQAKPILTPYTQIALFPWQKVERHLRLGYLIEEPGDENGEGEDEEWSPPWWAPLMISLSEGWDRAVDATQDLSFIGLYGLFRASQSAGDIVEISKEFPGLAIDTAWYGFPASGGPPTGVSGQLWLSGLTDTQLLHTHQWQYDGTQSTPNDCATTSMSMVINQTLNLLGYQGDPAQHGEMAGLLDSAPGRIFRIYRVPACVPTIRLGQMVIESRGAMPPGGTADALNQFANEMREAGYPQAWTAEVSGHNTVDDLIDNIQNGNPTILYGVWDNGTPHAMVLAGYDASNDVWKILDPGNAPDPITNAPSFLEMHTSDLEEWWGRRYFAYQRNTTVVLKIDSELSAIETITPTAQPVPTPSITTETPAAQLSATPNPTDSETLPLQPTETPSPTDSETLKP